MQARSLTQSEMRNISEEKKDLLVEHYQIRRNGTLEREVIQSIGFRNTVEDGKVTGFQFSVRLSH